MGEQEQQESMGRIEIAPEVLTTIACHVVQGVPGVHRMAAVPADVARLFRRAARQDGVLLDYADGKLFFDIYIMADPHVNVLETSRSVQAAVAEAIDKMVGVTIDAVNVHVEDVVYILDETA